MIRRLLENVPTFPALFSTYNIFACHLPIGFYCSATFSHVFSSWSPTRWVMTNPRWHPGGRNWFQGRNRSLGVTFYDQTIGINVTFNCQISYEKIWKDETYRIDWSLSISIINYIFFSMFWFHIWTIGFFLGARVLFLHQADDTFDQSQSGATGAENFMLHIEVDWHVPAI